jgi:hypothetical protein
LDGFSHKLLLIISKRTGILTFENAHSAMQFAKIRQSATLLATTSQHFPFFATTDSRLL